MIPNDICADCAVRDRALCGSLDDRELLALNAIGQRRRVARGQTIAWAGDEAVICGNLLTGVLKLVAATADGREQTVGLLYPADFFGQPYAGDVDFTLTALTEAETELTGGLSPRVSPFPELRDCAHLLQRAGFVLPVADQEDIRLLYADPFALVRDLRAAGETNAVRLRDRRIPPRALVPLALSAMPEEDDRFLATLRMAVMTGWGPAGDR